MWDSAQICTHVFFYTIGSGIREYESQNTVELKNPGIQGFRESGIQGFRE